MNRFLIVAALPLLSGCLFMGGGKKTIYNEGERIPVSFENQAASEDFHIGLELADRTDYMDSGGFVVLFIAASGGGVFHETPFYNAQVRRADVNGDRTIGAKEASEYRRAMTAAHRKD